jgi:hypothetical protein
MNLQIPIPGTTSGPLYATDISNDLSTISDHTHTGASANDGNQLTPASLNINSDLNINSNNITSLRSARFNSQSGTLSGVSDINCLYVDSGDLYYNNSAGTAVKVTSGSLVYATSTNNYPSVATSINYTITSSETTIMVNVDCHLAAVTVTLPTTGSVGTGRFYIVKDRLGASASSGAITVKAAGSELIDGQNTYIIADGYGAATFVNTGSAWMLVKANNLMINSDFLRGRNNANSAYVNLLGIDSSDQVSIGASTNINKLNGGLRVQVTNISSNYTVDSGGGSDYALFVDTTSGTVSITLPALDSNSRVLVVKDVGGVSGGTHHIILVRNSGVGNIEGLANDRTLSTNYGSWTIMSDSYGNWWLV